MSIVKKTFCIPDMHCSACVMKLEGLEDEVPGVLFVEGSYQKQTLIVEFDDSLVAERDIRNIVEKLGYAVVRG